MNANRTRKLGLFFYNGSLKRRTLLVIAVLLLSFGLLFAVIYTSMVQSMTEEREKKAVKLTLNNAFSNIHAALDGYSDMSRLIMLNSDVAEFLTSRTKAAHLASRARTGIYSITNIYSYVDSVYLFRLDGESINTGQGITLLNSRLMQSPSWREPLLRAKGAAVIMINGDGAIYKRSGMPLITLSRMVYDVNTQKIIGILLVNISSEALREPLHSAAEEDGRICAFSDGGQVLFGDEGLSPYYDEGLDPNQESYRLLHENGTQKVVSARRGEALPIAILYMNDVRPDAVFPKQSIILVLVLMLAVVFSVALIGIFVTFNITKPIERLTKAIDETKSSGYLQHIELSLPPNELGRLEESYNSMIDHLNELIEQLIENEKSVQKAEMRILHEQIKPHFLYNSLETISYMAVEANAPRVHDALETLGSFYRNFLSKGSREIPLKREIKITQDYLALQRLRYGAIFEDEYEVDPRAENCLIPKLILQPLVENSLYHGIQLKGEKGFIRVRVKKEENGTISVTLYDTGVGMSQEQINDALSDTLAEADALSGFGLKGTIERIRYYCNSQDAVQIKSEIGEYTEIKIVIPIKN